MHYFDTKSGLFTSCYEYPSSSMDGFRGLPGEASLNGSNSKKLKVEQSKWYKRLKSEGFEDIEQSNSEFHGRRYCYRERLKGQQTLDFFLHLDWLLTFYEGMPDFERKVMSLYSDGIYIKEIVKKVKASDKHVRNVIKRYKHLIKAIIAMLTNTDNVLSLRLVSNKVSEDTANADVRVQDKAA